MSVKSVQFAVASHIMAALGFYNGEEVSSATLAESVNANPTFVRKSLSKLSKGGGGRDDTRKKRGERTCTCAQTDHAVRYIPCKCGNISGKSVVQSGRLGSFTGDLNRDLAAFGYACNAALEPFEIRVISSTHAPIGLPLNHLSEPEQFRFGVAFQVALAMVTDLRFVVIDRADMLDRERRRMLTGLWVNSGLDQAIVLATSEEAPPSVVPQGVRFVTLAERTRPCEAAVATAV
jgi:hypothetical protein